MIKHISILLLFLAGCITIGDYDDLFPKEKVQPQYKVGQCFIVFDPESNKYRPDDIVKVEAIYNNVYWYRWWLPQKEWALELNSGIGKFETFERMTYLTECPK